MMKKDPSEEGEGLAPTSPTSVSTAHEQTTIKANKGMILRKVRPRATSHTSCV